MKRGVSFYALREPADGPLRQSKKSGDVIVNAGASPVANHELVRSVRPAGAILRFAMWTRRSSSSLFSSASKALPSFARTHSHSWWAITRFTTSSHDSSVPSSSGR
eukprot:jgi/Mesvir1/14782/Mv05422-RA.1